MKRTPTLPLTLLAFVGALAPAAQASVILYDGFELGGNAATGQYTNDARWGPGVGPTLTNFTGNWTTGTSTSTNLDFFTRSSFGLSVGDLVVEGGGVGAQRVGGANSPGSSIDYSRGVAGGNNFALGTTYYFSFLLRQTSFGSFSGWGFNYGNGSFAVGFNTSGLLALWHGNSGSHNAGTGTQRFAVGTDGTGSGAAFALDTTYFISGKLQIAASDTNTDVLTLFAPQTSSIPGSEPSAFGSASYTGDFYNAARNFTGITLSGFQPASSPGTAVIYDELRLGTTWADIAPVVPEPSAALSLLAGFGLLALLRRRSGM